ncbi:beta/alpha barrel domain-containing protein [[Clostridium] polysaccharolyticum]|uniref:dihydrouracil dehydrogenase (NAD(+)) n=1 Tax=[Clostridium] polysaccharolyticum TaxID=29364 RepID=A0A1H9Z9D1_9FIRM|nr:hypothetical protein [[Clostridium] polysaccharolyticum]SES78089.1 dihydroorotate dehydrogenase (fumarate) [[Clostridium] polysaccharolyticum]
MFSYRESKEKIFIASSNITDNNVCMERLYSYGVAGIITKSISLHHMDKRKERIWSNGNDLYNTTRFSKRSFHEWLPILSQAAKEGRIMIPSICPNDNVELDYIIKHLEQIGVPAIELGISCPNTTNIPWQTILNGVEKLASKVKVPIYLKLCGKYSILPIVRRAVGTGIKGIVLSDSFPVNIPDGGNVISAGQSGESIRPQVLQQIRTLRLADIDCEIVGTGGVFTKEHVNEYLKAGADAVGICSAMYLFGITHIQTLL